MHELSPSASVPTLWSTPGVTLPYVPAEGSPAPADAPGTYTHDRLVDVLVALLDRYGPTHVRTLDPDPDIQLHDRRHPRDSDQFGYSDHRDHTAVALFTWKALARWAAPGGGGRDFTAAAYRGYYNQRWPFNLPPATVALKGRFMVEYGGDPGWQCGSPGGCGDYGQGRDQPLANRKGWIRSTHPRYPGAGPVVVAAPGARRTAYEVRGLRAVVRTETAPGSGRYGPAAGLGGGPLAPRLACVAVPGAGTLVFGLRFAALQGKGGGNGRDVVLREAGRWTSLGSPEHSENRGRRVGPPAALRTPDGRVHLFVRNADKGLSTRVREPGGAWGRGPISAAARCRRGWRRSSTAWAGRTSSRPAATPSTTGPSRPRPPRSPPAPRPASPARATAPPPP